jgi:type II secretory ATPase GspE/PulE/Tfp pilus assembly ATPase PilB-like protein
MGVELLVILGEIYFVKNFNLKFGMSHFLNYYQDTINTNSTGLKLVLGGTGLGKTSSIKTVLKESANEGKKFIYIANRIQL